jgi:hypothetical protein
VGQGELHNLYPSSGIIDMIRSVMMIWAWNVSRVRNLYKISVGNPVGERQLRRPRRRWENNINLHLK